MGVEHSPRSAKAGVFQSLPRIPAGAQRTSEAEESSHWILGTALRVRFNPLQPRVFLASQYVLSAPEPRSVTIPGAGGPLGVGQHFLYYLLLSLSFLGACLVGVPLGKTGTTQKMLLAQLMHRRFFFRGPSSAEMGWACSQSAL